MFIRDYTINVAYETAETSFNVSVIAYDSDDSDDSDDFDDIDDSDDSVEDFEVLSITMPEKTKYVIEEDILFDEETGFYYVNFDLTGIAVTVLDPGTGEIMNFGKDDIYINYSIDPDEEIVAGPCCITCYISISEVEDVMFEFNFELVNAEKKEETTQPTTEKTDNSAVEETTSTNQSATEGTSSVTGSDNGTVQTGSSSNSGILVILMLSAVIIAVLVYKKKISE